MKPLTRTVNGVSQPLYVLRYVDTKFVTISRAISNTLGTPNPGPNLEYLAILTDDPPDFDQTFTVLTQTEGPNETTVPPQWEIHYVVTDRPKSEQHDAADNAARFQVQAQVPPQDSTEIIVRTLAAVLRDAKGLQLTAGEQAFKDQLMKLAAGLEANAANLADIHAAIDAGNKPDLSAGWAPIQPALADPVTDAQVAPSQALTP